VSESPRQDPLELLEKHRVLFQELKAFVPTLKLQLVSHNPLDLQFVVDLVPKTFLSGRTGGVFQKPQPKAYLHVKTEDAGALDQMVLLALATRLIVQNNGKLVGKLELISQIKGWFETWVEPVASSTYYALENMQRDRKVNEIIEVAPT